jgi:hypothetical protein
LVSTAAGRPAAVAPTARRAARSRGGSSSSWCHDRLLHIDRRPAVTIAAGVSARVVLILPRRFSRRRKAGTCWRSGLSSIAASTSIGLRWARGRIKWTPAGPRRWTCGSLLRRRRRNKPVRALRVPLGRSGRLLGSRTSVRVTGVVWAKAVETRALCALLRLVASRNGPAGPPRVLLRLIVGRGCAAVGATLRSFRLDRCTLTSSTEEALVSGSPTWDSPRAHLPIGRTETFVRGRHGVPSGDHGCLL